MNRVVFLDYDGVVNRKMWSKVDGEWVCRYGYPEDGMVNDLQAVQWVSEFCEKYGYDIVVTSTWRKYPEWEACLRGAGLRDTVKILGATALPPKDRAEEISEYLAAHPDVDAYLVFDDNSSLLFSDVDGSVVGSSGVHSDNLVLTSAERGFGEEEYNTAVALHLKQKYRSSPDASRSFVESRDLKGLLNAGIELLYSVGEISSSLLQRSFEIGYGRAMEVLDTLVEKGIAMRKNRNGATKYLPLIEYEEAKAKI